MRVHYYYHISKTGGTSVLDFFKHVANHVPRCRLYDFNDWDNLSPTQKDIDFDSILARDNLAKYDHVLIHHHHGSQGADALRRLFVCEKKRACARRAHYENFHDNQRCRVVQPFETELPGKHRAMVRPGIRLHDERDPFQHADEISVFLLARRVAHRRRDWSNNH